MNLVLLGVPGSGKGTQSKLISKNFGIPHISTGEIFRENISQKTKLGILAEEYIINGQLVPDEITFEVIKKRLSQPDCKNGYILDGFPRTLAQGKALKTFAKIDRVILLDITLDELKRRILGRRTCEDCGEIYNTSNYALDYCAKCNGKLISRSDDTEQTINKRVSVYEQQTKPLIDFYNEENLLLVVDCNNSPEEIFKIIESKLKIEGRFEI